MSVKLKNLKKFWLEEGYKILRTNVSEDRGVVFEVDVVFERLDGKPVNFYEEWNSFKWLANRQQFHAIPIVDVIDRKLSNARVLLIDRESIKKAVPLWANMMKEIHGSYWYAQMDKEILELETNIVDLNLLIRAIQSEIDEMKSYMRSRRLLETNKTYDKWLEYKQGVYDLVGEVYESEKITDELRQILDEISILYDLVV